MKAIDRAHIDAVSKFTFDTVLSDYKSHNFYQERLMEDYTNLVRYISRNEQLIEHQAAI